MNKGKNEEDREDDEALPPRKTEEEESEDTEDEDTEEEEESDEEENEDSDESKGDDESEEDDSEQDIDFEKELEALEKGEPEPSKKDEEQEPPKRKSEEEKAGYTIRETIKRLKKLGKSDAEISKITGIDIKTEDDSDEEEGDEEKGYVTRDELDLRDADREAERLAKSAAEKKVIMWYVRNKRLSVTDAHLLANKGRIRRASEEMQRGNQRAANFSGGGRKKVVGDQIPKFSKQEMDLFKRRNMTWNPKSKRMEGQYVWVAVDPKTGKRKTGRIEKKA
jgi:hypothetical protein